MRVGNVTGLVRSANGVKMFLVVELNFKRAIFYHFELFQIHHAPSPHPPFCPVDSHSQ